MVNYIPGHATVKGASDVTQGDAISLTCELSDSGNPLATFKWQMKNNDGVVKNLVEVSSTLKIPTSKREDEGVYVCWGINTIGEGAKGEMKVNVNVVPAIGSDWKSTVDVKENKVGQIFNAIRCFFSSREIQSRSRWLSLGPTLGRYVEFLP